MKSSTYSLLLSLLCVVSGSVALFGLTACDENQELAYAELREKEDKQIQNFLRKGCTVRDADNTFDLLKVKGDIRVISEHDFLANDTTTNVERNEYVFHPSGVYFQILRRGTGKPLQEGEHTLLVCRFTEFNIATDSISKTNNTFTYEHNPDVIAISQRYGSYTATFVSGLMFNHHGLQVPKGWLTVLRYLKLDRQTTAEGEIAKVRLIVPSTEGQKDAQSRIYPCFYELTLQRAR